MKERGFIDLHTHGMGRYDTRTKSPEHILKLMEIYGCAGLSGILPAIYPGPIEKMRQNMNAIRKATESQAPSLKKQALQGKCAAILGIHLEGPFLNPLRCGALDGSTFLKPSVPNLKRLVQGFEDYVKIITIAPELPGALKVIEKCVELGIRVNMGHSDATFRQAMDGKKAGARGVTHLFNAMRPMHHREPGLAGFGLLEDDLYVEVIPDGVHLLPETLKLIFRIKNKNRVILVSDSIKGAMYKKGLLQGGNISISQAGKILKKAGIPEAWIIRAARDNPERYLKSG